MFFFLWLLFLLPFFFCPAKTDLFSVCQKRKKKKKKKKKTALSLLDALSFDLKEKKTYLRYPHPFVPFLSIVGLGRRRTQLTANQPWPAPRKSFLLASSHPISHICLLWQNHPDLGSWISGMHSNPIWAHRFCQFCHPYLRYRYRVCFQWSFSEGCFLSVQSLLLPSFFLTLCPLPLLTCSFGVFLLSNVPKQWTANVKFWTLPTEKASYFALDMTLTSMCTITTTTALSIAFCQGTSGRFGSCFTLTRPSFPPPSTTPSRDGRFQETPSNVQQLYMGTRDMSMPWKEENLV